jgi:hypothetical protein
MTGQSTSTGGGTSSGWRRAHAVHHKMTGLMTTISAAGCQLEQSVQRRNWSPSPDDTPGSTPIGESGSLSSTSMDDSRRSVWLVCIQPGAATTTFGCVLRGF